MDSPHAQEFQGLIQTHAVHAHQSFAGINPFIQLSDNTCIHTRFLAPSEILAQRHVVQCKSSLGHLRSLLEKSQRGGKNLLEECEKRTQQRDGWKAEARKHATEAKAIRFLKDELEGSLKTLQDELRKVEKDRDEMSKMVDIEKQKAEAAEECRQVAVSSLRKRWNAQKMQWEQAMGTVQGLLLEKERELLKVKSFADESVEHIEGLERTIAKLEKDWMVSDISRQLSQALSDMSDVAVMRSDNDQTVSEKIRDLRDCIKDLVKETKSRRANTNRWIEKVYGLEEEKLMWVSNEKKHEADRAEFIRLLHRASREIAILRQRGQDEGLYGSSSNTNIGD